MSEFQKAPQDEHIQRVRKTMDNLKAVRWTDPGAVAARDEDTNVAALLMQTEQVSTPPQVKKTSALDSEPSSEDETPEVAEEEEEEEEVIAPPPKKAAAVAKAVAKPVAKPVPKAAPKPVAKPAPAAVAKPVAKAVAKPAAPVKKGPVLDSDEDEDIAKPAPKAAPKPVAKPAAKPVPKAEPVAKPVPQPVAKPPAKPVARPVAELDSSSESEEDEKKEEEEEESEKSEKSEEVEEVEEAEESEESEAAEEAEEADEPVVARKRLGVELIDSDEEDNYKQTLENEKEKMKHYTNTAAWDQVVSESGSEDEDNAEDGFKSSDDGSEEGQELLEDIPSDEEAASEDEEDQDLVPPPKVVTVHKTKARLRRDKEKNAVNKIGKADPAKSLHSIRLNKSANGTVGVIQELMNVVKLPAQLSAIQILTEYFEMDEKYAWTGLGRALCSVMVTGNVMHAIPNPRVKELFDGRPIWVTVMRGIIRAFADPQNSGEYLADTSELREDEAKLRVLLTEQYSAVRAAIAKKYRILDEILKIADQTGGFTLREPAVCECSKFGSKLICCVTGMEITGTMKVAELEVSLTCTKRGEVARFAVLGGLDPKIPAAESYNLTNENIFTLLQALKFMQDQTFLYSHTVNTFNKMAKAKGVKMDCPVKVFCSSVAGSILSAQASACVVSYVNATQCVIESAQ